MTLNLKLILVTELALALNFTGLAIKGGDKIKESEKKDKKAKKLSTPEIQKFTIRPVFDWDKQYERTLEFIKDHEGFAHGQAYMCPGGYKTIGYGHIILENEKLSQITEQQADSILRIDFNKAIHSLDTYIELSGSKRLAMAHFVFTKGIGSFNRSTLKKKILKKESINDELIKWCYYTNSKGEKVKSQHALNIRNWELDLYNFRS